MASVQSDATYSEHNNSPRKEETDVDIVISSENQATMFRHSSEQSIQVTWEDLWVTVPNGKSRKPILQGLTGYAKPGELLAIMGPSGCGKSTLLDALAGRLASNTKQHGKILINGHKQALAYGTSNQAYVTQDDAMLHTLTTGEAVYYSAQLQFPDSMPKAEKKERAEITIREMGLQDAINTRIGGWASKGLSGGQKRRLSICIEILTRPRLLFLDEPTSGLDSAASYYVMTTIASLNLRDGIKRTIVASIHQPSSEVFQLFHNLCLLSSGETVYFGPASDANEFFVSNNFPCPTLYNPSDHFLRIIDKDFKEDAKGGLGTGVSTEEAINILLKSYRSAINDKVQKEVSEICGSDSGEIEKRSHAGFLAQCLVLIRRSSLHMYRDISNYWLRLLVNITIAISLGMIFYDIGSGSESIQARGSILTFSVSVITFITLIGGFPPFIEEMKVFERERLNGHYGVTAFLIGNTFSAAPYMLSISLIPAAIAYYLSGLQKGFEHFLYFTCVLFATVMSVETLMMLVARIFPNFIMGMIIVGGLQGLMLLLSGFYRLPGDLPKPFWRYPLYYVSFQKYAFQGLFKNEFDGLTFFREQVRVTGKEILKETWQMEMDHSKWVDFAVLLGMIVFCRFMFLGVVKIKERLNR